MIQVEENAMDENGFTHNIVSQETKAIIPFRQLLVVEHSLLIDEVRTLIDSGPDGRGSKGSGLGFANQLTPSLGFQPIGERKEEKFSDLGLWRLEYLKSHDSTVVHNCCQLLKFYETNPAITSNSVIDTSYRTEKWMKIGEVCMRLFEDLELSYIKLASSTLIVSEERTSEEPHESKEKFVAIEGLKVNEENATSLDRSYAAETYVNWKDQLLKLSAQKSVRYWEGRGIMMKMKWKIKAVSYHPP
ncbi:unnamed protein product [Cuscuta europaea]|uniref:Uncharacterized protein n=1 Tax=Cuscuta europaea TaxID=41803 RepID=A0A9P1E276_CUSEU|nr:unnamed protein product [Cuscuta europaea]